MSRTKLVKLVYFADYIYFQHTGRTLTGVTYRWHHYGPNAEHDDIVKPPERPPLEDELATRIIDDVVSRFRHCTASEIADASKLTPPFKGATQGPKLQFDRPDAYYRQREAVEPLAADELAELRSGSGVPIEELKAKYRIA